VVGEEEEEHQEEGVAAGEGFRQEEEVVEDLPGAVEELAVEEGVAVGEWEQERKLLSSLTDMPEYLLPEGRRMRW